MARNTKRRSRWVALLGLAALAVAVLAASPIIGLESWLGELASSWRPHVAIGAMAVALICLMARYRWLAGLLVALALILGADVMWTGLVSAQAEARTMARNEPPMARVMFSNVLRSNGSLEDLMDWVEDRDPDLLVLTEVTPDHVAEIDEAMAGYPHRVLEPRLHAFGITVHSRFPVLEQMVMTLTDDTLSDGGPIMLIVTVETEEGPLTVAGLHPFPPSMPTSMIARDRQLDAAADALWRLDGRLVVVGDFNATPWSPALRRFADDVGLHGLNIAATWPVWFGFAGIPIDHALAGDELFITEIETGPDIGSDHRPVMIGVAPVQGSPGTP